MKIYKVLPFLLSIILLVGNTTAGGQTKDEEQQLKDYVSKLISDGYSLFNDQNLSTSERDNKTKKLLEQNLHLDWMAKYSLGRHRRTLSKEKIAEFTNIYRQFVLKAYVDLAKHYNGEKANLKQVRQIDDDLFIVKMEIVQPGSRSPIKVDYLVHQLEDVKGELFKVGDIVTEGISILNSQQSEFNSVITNKGIDALIDDLKLKMNKNETKIAEKNS